MGDENYWRDKAEEYHDALQAIDLTAADVETLSREFAKTCREKSDRIAALESELAEATHPRDAKWREAKMLKSCLRILDDITRGKSEPTGNEPEWICEIVERWVRLRAELAEAKAEIEELVYRTALFVDVIANFAKEGMTAEDVASLDLFQRVRALTHPEQATQEPGDE